MSWNILRPRLKTNLLRLAEKCLKETYAWHERTDFSDKCIQILVGMILACTFTSILRIEPVTKRLGDFAYYVLLIAAVSKFIKLNNNE